MPDESTIWFDMAGGNVVELIIQVGEKFPTVEFHYIWEIGLNWQYGKLKIENGEVKILKINAFYGIIQLF